jgi:hypothetical protein
MVGVALRKHWPVGVLDSHDKSLKISPYGMVICYLHDAGCESSVGTCTVYSYRPDMLLFSHSNTEYSLT